MEISFRVIGEPKGQPRPRAFAFAGRARIYDAGTAEGWKGLVAEAVRDRLPETPICGPCSMSIVFFMPRPKSHFRTGKNAGVLKDNAPSWFTSKPDIDNLQKAVMDALTVVGVFTDDALVVDGKSTKVYASPNERPGAQVTIITL